MTAGRLIRKEPTQKQLKGSGLQNQRLVAVKGEDKKRERPVQTRDSEDTQTARERSNTVRGGKRMNKKERQAQKNINRLSYVTEVKAKKHKDGNPIMEVRLRQVFYEVWSRCPRLKAKERQKISFC